MDLRVALRLGKDVRVGNRNHVRVGAEVVLRHFEVGDDFALALFVEIPAVQSRQHTEHAALGVVEADAAVKPLLQALLGRMRIVADLAAATEAFRATGGGWDFVTATGDRDVIRGEHFDRMRDGAIIANAGHFNVEIDIAALRERAVATASPRPSVEEFVLADGRSISLLAAGRLDRKSTRLNSSHT